MKQPSYYSTTTNDNSNTTNTGFPTIFYYTDYYAINQHVNFNINYHNNSGHNMSNRITNNARNGESDDLSNQQDTNEFSTVDQQGLVVAPGTGEQRSSSTSSSSSSSPPVSPPHQLEENYDYIHHTKGQQHQHQQQQQQQQQYLHYDTQQPQSFGEGETYFYPDSTNNSPNHQMNHHYHHHDFLGTNATHNYPPYSLPDMNIANLGTFLPIPPPPPNVQGCSSQDNDLLTLVQSYEWSAALERISTHPCEATSVGEQGRTPLHVACDHDAPAFVVKALLQANPSAVTMVGTSDMNPLHITCSSQHASVEVVRVLLDGCEDVCKITAMKDVDGDTPLHAACRCGAPIEVLEVLLRANPQLVHDRDYEGLTPLLRLWVRYFVMLGDDTINSVAHRNDVTGELEEAWNKTELLLRAAYCGLLDSYDSFTGSGQNATATSDTATNNNNNVDDGNEPQPESVDGRTEQPFYVLHAASRVDCPRAVVKIATVLYPQQLHEYDSTMRTPLMIATVAPVFKEHDLSGEGYSIEELIHGDEEDEEEEDDVYASRSRHDDDDRVEQKQPTVIQILLEAGAKANHGNRNLKKGRLPLHSAIVSGKRWNEGLKCLRNAYPDSLIKIDQETGLYPFMLAAAVGGAALKDEITTVGRSADLTTIFEILRSRPDQCDIIDG